TRFIGEKFSQTIEEFRITRGPIFTLQARQHLFEKRQRPPPLVNSIGAQCVCRLQIGTLAREQFIQGNQRSALAASECQFAAPRLRQEILQRDEQIRTQPSFFAADNVEITAFQQQGEEPLSQILSFFRRVAVASDEAVKRPPVGAAKFFQSLLGRGGSTLRR